MLVYIYYNAIDTGEMPTHVIVVFMTPTLSKSKSNTLTDTYLRGTVRRDVASGHAPAQGGARTGAGRSVLGARKSIKEERTQHAGCVH